MSSLLREFFLLGRANPGCLAKDYRSYFGHLVDLPGKVLSTSSDENSGNATSEAINYKPVLSDETFNFPPQLFHCKWLDDIVVASNANAHLKVRWAE
jgi:hypothetical protein